MSGPRRSVRLLVGLWGWLGCALIAAAAEPTLGPAQNLRETLRQWEAQNLQISRLQEELHQLDVLSDPDRDEKYWWNPFWRWSKDNQAQQATEITLHLQQLETQQLELERRLLPESERFARQALENPRLSPTDREVWLAVDAWRLPRLLTEPDWESLAPPDEPQARELVRSRLQAVDALEGPWRALDDYLTACLRIWSAGSKEADDYQAWQERLRKLRSRLASVREALEKQAD
jgi:hypothetical protein